MMFRYFLVTCFFFKLVTSVFAEPVFVVGETHGQAFLFNHSGLCYAVLPAHVVPRRFNLSYESASPVRRGETGENLLSFPASGMDLSLQTVLGPLESPCEPSWSSLSKSLDRLLAGQPVGEIVISYSNQALARVPATVTDVLYENILVTPVHSYDLKKLSKGISGALFKVDDMPVGIVIEGPSVQNHQRVKILRMDAIRARIGRKVESLELLPKKGETNIAVNQRGDEIPFEVVDWNITPYTPSTSPTNLANRTNHAPFISQPPQAQVTLELKLLTDKAAVLREVVIETNVDDSDTSAPKKVQIHVKSERVQTRNAPRLFGQADMSPRGIFRLKRGAGTYATRVFVTFKSLWSPGKPLRVDKIMLR